MDKAGEAGDRPRTNIVMPASQSMPSWRHGKRRVSREASAKTGRNLTRLTSVMNKAV